MKSAFVVVQLLSHVGLFGTPWTAACQASLSLTTPGVHPNSCPSSQWCHPTNHLILCCPLLLLPSIFPSIRVFSDESALHIRWPKYWSFSVSAGPSNDHSRLISFRIDWLDLLAVQGILKHLLQHHSLKASILWPSSGNWRGFIFQGANLGAGAHCGKGIRGGNSCQDHREEDSVQIVALRKWGLPVWGTQSTRRDLSGREEAGQQPDFGHSFLPRS